MVKSIERGSQEPEEPKEKEPSKTDKLLIALDRFSPASGGDDAETWTSIYNSLYGRDFSSVEEFRDTFIKEIEDKNWEIKSRPIELEKNLDSIMRVIKAFQEK
jgi:hypothetical protein